MKQKGYISSGRGGTNWSQEGDDRVTSLLPYAGVAREIAVWLPTCSAISRAARNCSTGLPLG